MVVFGCGDWLLFVMNLFYLVIGEFDVDVVWCLCDKYECIDYE